MPYLNSKILDKHKAGCKKPKAKRLYIREYVDKDKDQRIFKPYGIVCPSCKVIILDTEDEKDKNKDKYQTSTKPELKPKAKTEALEICRICQKPGTHKLIKTLAKGKATLEAYYHDDGIEHRYGSHAGLPKGLDSRTREKIIEWAKSSIGTERTKAANPASTPKLQQLRSKSKPEVCGLMTLEEFAKSDLRKRSKLGCQNPLEYEVYCAHGSSPGWDKLCEVHAREAIKFYGTERERREYLKPILKAEARSEHS